ncbi:formate hydrogenlyase [Paraburkholderia monticola]|uniref:Formate hydrogenlyase n=1 Tax=Paraburkholderia monticola TaxID=1399968 RepID=A0A149PKL8_9BURK|nr:NADH-quinone oxidoreductase subunit B family protein [Paraburkholderia monticola]KXU85582.1 formate hydrogenlyase [Paraburkholderia monticola]
MWQLIRRFASTPFPDEAVPQAELAWRREAQRIQQSVLDLMGRALCIRQIDAGSCNGCELEIHALNNPYYNIEGLGIKFVASPRHADLLLVTGPVTLNMRAALLAAYEATPHPKLVVAAGECACTGGLFRDSYAVCGPLSSILPVDVMIPGCPPSPVDLLRGILAACQQGGVTGTGACRPR